MSEQNINKQAQGDEVQAQETAVSITREEMDFKPQKVYTSLNIETLEGKVAALKAMSQPDVANEELQGKVFYLQDIFIHTVELENEETGEKQECRRAVLISPEGLTTAFVSEGIVRGLQNLMALFGNAPWDPALPVEIKQIKTARGRRTYNLALDETKLKG